MIDSPFFFFFSCLLVCLLVRLQSMIIQLTYKKNPFVYVFNKGLLVFYTVGWQQIIRAMTKKPPYPIIRTQELGTQQLLFVVCAPCHALPCIDSMEMPVPLSFFCASFTLYGGTLSTWPNPNQTTNNYKPNQTKPYPHYIHNSDCCCFLSLKLYLLELAAYWLELKNSSTHSNSNQLIQLNSIYQMLLWKSLLSALGRQRGAIIWV